MPRAGIVNGAMPASALPALRDLRAHARRHWLFVSIVGIALGLRVVTQLAYWPALFFEDSYQYLGNVDALDPGHTRPIGYSVFLGLLLVLPDLAAIPAAQHLMGLAMGLITYVLLVRFGLWRWAAALFTLPVLWDAYQLEIEHMVMSDVLFQFLVLGALTLLVWGRPTPRRAALVGLLLGVSVSVRLVGLPLVIPATLAALVMTKEWRRRVAVATALTIAFAVPLVAYMAWFQYNYGKFALTDTGARIRYARVAHFVQCGQIPQLPPHQLALCPGKPISERLPPIGAYVWDPRSPAVQYVPPPGTAKEAVLRDFFWRVVANQPRDFAGAVTRDFLHYFRPQRDVYPPERPRTPWQFPTHFRTWGNNRDADVPTRAYGSSGAYIDESLAHALRAYQLNGGYTSGTVLGLALLAGLAGSLGVGRARRSGMRVVCFLYTSAGGGLLLAASLFMFSWRYQLPALVLLPVAGGLGLTAMLRGDIRRRGEHPQESSETEQSSPALVAVSAAS